MACTTRQKGGGEYEFNISQTGAILEREYDDGRLIYEGELQKDRWEYEFEIDGTTGAILE